MIRFDRSGLRAGFGRELVLDLYERASVAIDPGRCVASVLSCDGDRVQVGALRYGVPKAGVRLIAVGKAAVAMAASAAGRLGPALAGGVVVTRRGYGGTADRLPVFEAGHPIPDENGVRAAEAIGELADAAGAEDLVVCLLSGGGSALLPAPPRNVGLTDLAETTRLLLASGAPIEAINAVRRHLSTLHGGRLARRLRPATVITLALSDVVGDRPEAIASGPTVPDPTTVVDAVEVLRRYGLWWRVSPSVRKYLVGGDDRETLKLGDPAFDRTAFRILASNATFLDALEGAANAEGDRVFRRTEPIVGEARGAGRAVGRRAVAVAREGAERAVLLAGGETTVTVRGTGRGGRNQEVALAAALEIDGVDGVVVAALATDGTDGTTEAAGAIVDGETVGRVRRAGVDPVAALADNDSYAALAASGDLLRTGPTGTNVADACVALVVPAR